MTDKYRNSRAESLSSNRTGGYINFTDNAGSVYLLFLSILNFAAYGWAFYLCNGKLPEISGSLLFIIFMLIAVNWVFSALIVNEQRIESAGRRWLNKNLDEKGLETLREYKDYLRANDYSTPGEWAVTKLLISLFNAVPLSALICVLIFEKFDEGRLTVIFLSALFLLTGLAHIVLSCYSDDIEQG